ncbi:pectin lyase fold/virulence factor [Phakopsora pachyrhizi]|uniref:Pectate lyase n=1 Tax=Phakopsora pachyrhizi TaxID=170000 RepID=A0AAV0AJ31_PHAPC|nr:pectin lyase fold/virulence factor [Phakopsora pachyrhizi]CAH7668483.1 pectin lyase fold/virulence factor [Phakopsora pachyrhizi]
MASISLQVSLVLALIAIFALPGKCLPGKQFGSGSLTYTKLEARASGQCDSNWPKIDGIVSLKEQKLINEDFDCQNKLYKSSGGRVFRVSGGVTISNCFFEQSGESDTIQIEGSGSYTVSNCYFKSTGDDGISIKGAADVTIKNVYFMKAGNKAVQHDGSGTVTIIGGCFQDVHILAKSCGNCEVNSSVSGRTINVKDVTIIDVKTVCGVNTNKNDVCTVTGLKGTPTESVCTGYEGITNPSILPKQTSKNEKNAHCVF